MKIKNAEFIVSNTDYKSCPFTQKPEYSFIGRSNVGKSSLINALVNRKNLAKISGKPGKTQLINHFLINNSWYLVDLPGYGYAKTSKSKRLIFQKMINDYLLYRSNLVCVFVLIDIRLKPQKIDQKFMQWLSKEKIPFSIIFTKKDKMSINLLNKNIKYYSEKMLEEWEYLPKMFITSAEKKLGIDEILVYIENLNLTY